MSNYDLLKYYGTIVWQEYVKEYTWNDIKFFQYIIKLDNCDGTFLINRADNLEQAIIRAKIQFNLNEEGTKISKYRIVGFDTSKEDKNKRVKELIEKRKIKENGTT